MNDSNSNDGKPKGGAPAAPKKAKPAVAPAGAPAAPMKAGPPGAMPAGPPGAPMKAGRAGAPPGAMPAGPPGAPRAAGPGGMPAGPPGAPMAAGPGGMPAGPPMAGGPGGMPAGGPMKAGPGGPVAGGPPPGGQGGMPGRAIRMQAPSGKIPYGKMLHWGWRIIMFAPVLFFSTQALVLIHSALGPINATIFSSTLVILGDGEPVGMVGRLMPDNKMYAALIFLIAGVSGIALGFIMKMMNTLTDNVMNKRLHQNLHDKLLTLGPSYHNKHDLGENLTIVTQFSTGAQMILGDMYSTPIIRIIMIVVTTVLVAEQFSTLKDFPLGLQIMLLVALAAIPVIGYWLSSRLKAAYTLVRDARIEVANEFTNSASLPLEVQIMGAQEQRSKTFGAKATRYFTDQFKAAIKNDMASQFRNSSILALQIMFVFSAAYYSVKSGDTKIVGLILSSYLLIPYVVGPVQDVIDFFAGINRSWPQVEKVVGLLEAEPDVSEKKGAEELKGGDPKVALKGVNFSYVDGGTKILDELSYDFAPDQVTAIVARAGGGKSTILNLVARLRDPQEGTVSIGEQDVRDVTFKSLRRNVAKVSQFPLYISASIRENMLLAKGDATDEELEAVCKKTGMWEVLVSAAGPNQHPLDYDLPMSVSEGLSGGQRRLFAITRAMLWKPAVLLLDEPTTGIDAIGKQMLITLLRESLEGITVLLVDHDMEFVAGVADKICCLEGGQFVDVGTPAELASRDNLYQRLVEAAEQEE